MMKCWRVTHGLANSIAKLAEGAQRRQETRRNQFRATLKWWPFLFFMKNLKRSAFLIFLNFPGTEGKDPFLDMIANQCFDFEVRNFRVRLNTRYRQSTWVFFFSLLKTDGQL